MTGTEQETPRFEVKRLDQLAGEIRNWLLDRMRDTHDSRAWDKRPAEAQQLAISHAECFGINLVRDVVEALAEDGGNPIKATLGKVTRNGDEVKSDVTLLMHEDDDQDGHSLFSASGKRVMIVVSDPEQYTGLDGRPDPDEDQGALDLGEAGEEEFDRVYLLSETAECAADDLPNNLWSLGEAGGRPGVVWGHNEPVPDENHRFVLEAKRSLDRNAEGDVETIGDFEPPVVVSEWSESESRWAAVTALPVPDDGLPDEDWKHGQTEVMLGVIWLIGPPKPSEAQPLVVEVSRTVERHKNGKIKQLGGWSDPQMVNRFDPSAGDDAAGEPEAS